MKQIDSFSIIKSKECGEKEKVIPVFFFLEVTATHTSSSSSSSVGATTRCGLWPVEQYLSIFPIYHKLFPSSHFQHLKISFHFFSSFFHWSSSSSRSFQFLSEHLFGHPILLHSLQVTQPT